MERAENSKTGNSVSTLHSNALTLRQGNGVSPSREFLMDRRGVSCDGFGGITPERLMTRVAPKSTGVMTRVRPSWKFPADVVDVAAAGGDAVMAGAVSLREKDKWIRQRK